MAFSDSTTSFETVVLPHLDAAFNLARWLMRDKADAEDVVQEAMVRALTYFKGFRGTNARGWFLQIVRNAAYASMKINRGLALVPMEKSEATAVEAMSFADPHDDPEVALMKEQERAQLERGLEELSVELREVLVLREFEELSYKEIADITGTPIGTVMSRLWRARRILTETILCGAQRT